MSELWDRVVATVERLEREGAEGIPRPGGPPPLPPGARGTGGEGERLGDLRALARRSLASIPDLGAAREDLDIQALSLGPPPPAGTSSTGALFSASPSAPPAPAREGVRATSIPPIEAAWPELGAVRDAPFPERPRGFHRLQAHATLAAAIALGAGLALLAPSAKPSAGRDVVSAFARISLSAHTEALQRVWGERRQGAAQAVRAGQTSVAITLEPVEIVAERPRRPKRTRRARPISATDPSAQVAGLASPAPAAIAKAPPTHAARAMTLEEAMRRAVGAPSSLPRGSGEGTAAARARR